VIQAGGDVVIMGGRDLSSLSFSTPAMFNETVWQPIPLKTDRRFAERMAESLPRLIAPEISNKISAKLFRGTPRLAIRCDIRIGDSTQVRTWPILIHSSANVGRGGDESVDWWIEPVPGSSQALSRLSRTHFSFQIRDGRAWLTDRSTNGTWLNGVRISKGECILLANNDVIEPAQVCRFRVFLAGNESTVHSILLVREDGLEGRLSYVLVNGAQPIPLAFSPNPTNIDWLLLTTAVSGQVAPLTWRDAEWKPAFSSESTSADSRAIGLRSIRTPVPQEVYLQPPT
jgi:hypothetical protein